MSSSCEFAHMLNNKTAFLFKGLKARHKRGAVLGVCVQCDTVQLDMCEHATELN